MSGKYDVRVLCRERANESTLAGCLGWKGGRANKVALITGVTGQDSAYLAELLLGKRYVRGIKRRSSTLNTGRVARLYRDLHEPDVRFKLHYGDLTDGTNLIRIIQVVRPTEIYNLGYRSHVQVKCGSTSLDVGDVYGKVQEIPQSETAPFYPRSPCGAAKL
jgi:GDPmannose 4,6-dehydratase